MIKNDSANRVQQLRALMNEIGADYYYVPTADDHNDEYPPHCWQRRAWISGFDGSAGVALIGKKDAYLWTDPRYFLQAEQQLDHSVFKIMKAGAGETPRIDQWLAQQNKPIVLATDPRVMSVDFAEKVKTALESIGGKLLILNENLIDRIWKDRSPLPSNPLRLQDTQYAGVSASEKLKALRNAMQQKKADVHVLNLLDAIAWLFNIRGTDIDFNPVVISYAIVTQKTATLFVDQNKISPENQSYFKSADIHLEPYENIAAALNQLAGTVWLDSATASLWMKEHIRSADCIYAPSPVTLMKALKNPTEQEGARTAHQIDAIAVIKFLQWLENHWHEGVTELSAEEKLKAFRLEDSRCVGLSFQTISGFGPHGAIIHYHATEETNSKIDDRSIYLIDSGGQYHYGTTDITRAIHLGTPTDEEKHLYTLVLKGHLALRHTAFPHGVCGEHLNALAHRALWQEALDFGHGTGHGVGAYLCVHEGPQAIAYRTTGVPLQPGMILSNEPGVYLADKFGIRIENLCLVTQKYTVLDSQTGHGPFYELNDLTLVPHCRKLINTAELSPDEIQWVNDYHQRVYDTLIDQLPTDELREWLTDATKPL